MPWHPNTRNINARIIAEKEIDAIVRRRFVNRIVIVDIASNTSRISSLVPDGGHCGTEKGGAEPREVVEITKEALELALTVTAPQAAPVGRPEQVRTYALADEFVIW